MPSSTRLVDFAYRQAFVAAVATLGALAVLGLVRAWVDEGRLPELTQSPLRGANRLSAAANKRGAWLELRQMAAVQSNSAEGLLAAAEGLARTGDFAGAEEALNAAVRRNPTSRSFLATVGWTLFWRGRFAEAEETFQNALAVDPDNHRLHAGLGEVYLQRDEYPKAQQAFQRALELASDDLGARNSLAITYALAGAHDKAITEFRDILKAGHSPEIEQNLRRALAAQAAARAAAR